MAAEPNATEPKTVHILITQCLQNGFFLSASNRLSLPEDEVSRMLIGAYEEEVEQTTQSMVQNLASKTPIFKKFVPTRKDNRRYYKRSDLKRGPLYRFLDTIINKKDKDGKNKRNAQLHVIHIKDWHPLSPRYDEERRLYGGHCEADTWEAEPIDGYEEFLRPWGFDKEKHKQAQSLSGYTDKENNPKVTFYEVLSDSVFDFKRSKSIKHHPEIEEKLQGAPQSVSHMSLLLDTLNVNNDNVYVTVIGVYTDIKIKILLMGLRSLYDLDNLIVSDVLTATPDLPRQLDALDFIDKVLNVEIVSDLNTIIGVLDTETRNEYGETSEEHSIPLELTANSIKWRDYRNNNLDKQNVLGYQDQLLAKYLKLTTRRSTEIYKQIHSANVFLTRVGRVSLVMLVLLLFLAATGLREIKLEVLIGTGLASATQIIPLFFTDAHEKMQQNLTRLVRLRNYLESYSMTTAIMRHHLTTPERLHDKDAENLKEQIAIISQAAKGLHENFKDLSYRTEETEGEPPTSAG